MQPDDTFWRRPDGTDAADGTGSADGFRPAPPAGGSPDDRPSSGAEADQAGWRRTPYPGLSYPGPPPMSPPPTGWHPPHHVEPAPPRRLPNQDHDHLDAEEARARTLTQGVALIAVAALVVLTCLLCGRLLF